jgi:hypothetical protein
MMKRSALKLTICRETLRVLGGMELIRVGGGNAGAPLFDSGNAVTGCPNVAPFDSAGPVTGCPLPAKP